MTVTAKRESMKFTYDARYNVAYIHLQEKRSEVETHHISDELNIDLAPDGTIYGIELLNANAQLRGLNGDKLSVINEATGDQVDVPLS